MPLRSRYPNVTEVSRSFYGLGSFGAAAPVAVPEGAPPAGPRKTTHAVNAARRLPAAGLPPGLQMRMGAANYLADMGAISGDQLAQEILTTNTYRSPSLSQAQQAALYGLGGGLGFGDDEGAEDDSFDWGDAFKTVGTTVAPVVGTLLPQNTIVAKLLGGGVKPAVVVAPVVSRPATSTQSGLVIAAIGLAGILGYMVLKRRNEALAGW
jgi:hypothetical protein